MASNNKSRARKEANKIKGDKQFSKVMSDLNKIIDTSEDMINHVTPRGQAFTRKPKPKPKPTLEF